MSSALRTAIAALALAALSVTGAQTGASAETRVTYKSAKTSSSYYQMAVQIAEAMKAGSDGGIIVTVEESQGSVQNVMEVKARGADYVFTTPPSLVFFLLWRTQRPPGYWISSSDGRSRWRRKMRSAKSLSNSLVSFQTPLLNVASIISEKLRPGRMKSGSPGQMFST